MVYRIQPGIIRLTAEPLHLKGILRYQDVFGKGRDLLIMREFVTSVIGLCAVGKDLYKDNRVQQDILVLVFVFLFFANHNDIRVGVFLLFLIFTFMSLAKTLQGLSSS